MKLIKKGNNYIGPIEDGTLYQIEKAWMEYMAMKELVQTLTINPEVLNNTIPRLADRYTEKYVTYNKLTRQLIDIIKEDNPEINFDLYNWEVLFNKKEIIFTPAQISV